MRLFSLILILMVSLVSNLAMAYEVSFNCGGSECTMDGIVFAPDTAYPGSEGAGYIAGSTSSASRSSQTGGPYQPPAVCSGYRQGDFSYQFDVPNGLYAMTLYFNEFANHGPGLREFPIQVNRTIYHEDFDIWAHGRMYYAFSVRLLVEVSQGAIVASFGSGSGDALLAGISIRDIQDEGLVPNPPTGMTTTPSYNAVNLSWDLPGDDVSGVVLYRSEHPDGPFVAVASRSDLAPFWVDYDVIPGTTYFYQITTKNLFDEESEASPTSSATVLSVEGALGPTYSITMDPADLEQLRRYPHLDLDYPAQLAFNGAPGGLVSVRYRGSLSRLISNKKSWKIKLDDGLLNERDRFNLNGDFIDLSQMVPLASFASFQQTRCLTPEIHKANLLVNNLYRGQFSEVEQIDELFLEKRGYIEVGNVYKCNSGLQLLSGPFYATQYEKKTNEEYGNDDLVSFIETINLTPDSELDDHLFPLLNLERQVDYYATRIFLADYDYFVRNYYLYHHLATDKWELIPWDLDLALDFQSSLSAIDLGTFATPSPNGWNRLFDRLLSVPKYRRFYCDRLTELMDSTFSEDSFTSMVDSLATTVSQEIERDFWKLRFDEEHLFPQRVNQIKSFGNTRRDFLQWAIEPYLAGTNSLFINEILVLNQNTLADEAQQFDSYIELYNWSNQPVQLSDYCLSNGTIDPLAGILPDEILPARSFTLLWADNETEQGDHHLPMTLSETSGQLMLYQLDNLTTAVDSLVYEAPVPDVAMALPIDGWWPLQEAAPTPGFTNVFDEGAATVFINEFMALNTTTMTDPQGEYEDWVELYNPSSEIINLTGFHLSDDVNNPARWSFPAGTTIAAQGFLLVWCDADETDSGLHTNFKLSAGGEAIALYGPVGAGLPNIDEYIFGPQSADISLARLPDGGPEWALCSAPTPGFSNHSLSGTNEAQAQWSFRLHPASPNPAARNTTIGFSLSENQEGPIELAVFDVRGRKVRKLASETGGPGRYSVVWNRRDDRGRDLPSGVYFIRLSGQQKQVTRKVVLVR